jgi:hypothetical protein
MDRHDSQPSLSRKESTFGSFTNRSETGGSVRASTVRRPPTSFLAHSRGKALLTPITTKELLRAAGNSSSDESGSDEDVNRYRRQKLREYVRSDGGVLIAKSSVFPSVGSVTTTAAEQNKISSRNLQALEKQEKAKQRSAAALAQELQSLPPVSIESDENGLHIAPAAVDISHFVGNCSGTDDTVHKRIATILLRERLARLEAEGEPLDRLELIGGGIAQKGKHSASMGGGFLQPAGVSTGTAESRESGIRFVGVVTDAFHRTVEEEPSSVERGSSFRRKKLRGEESSAPGILRQWFEVLTTKHPGAEALNHRSLGCVSPDNKIRIFCHNVLHSLGWEMFILICVAILVIFLALEDPTHAHVSHPTFIAELTFAAFFTVEMILKIFAFGLYKHRGAYLRSKWNVLDMFIVFLAYVALIPEVENFELVVAIRMLHPLRTINAVPGIKYLLVGLSRSFAGLVNVLILTLMVFFLAGILGVQIFGGVFRRRCINTSTGIVETTWYCKNGDDFGTLLNVTNTTADQWILHRKAVESEISRGLDSVWGGYWGRQCPSGYACVDDVAPHFGAMSFDHVGYAFLAIFQCVTFDGWYELLRISFYTSGQITFFYYFFIVLVGGYLIPNLVLATISDRFADAQKRMERQQMILRLLHDRSLYMAQLDSLPAFIHRRTLEQKPITLRASDENMVLFPKVFGEAPTAAQRGTPRRLLTMRGNSGGEHPTSSLQVTDAWRTGVSRANPNEEKITGSATIVRGEEPNFDAVGPTATRSEQAAPVSAPLVVVVEADTAQPTGGADGMETLPQGGDSVEILVLQEKKEGTGGFALGASAATPQDRRGDDPMKASFSQGGTPATGLTLRDQLEQRLKELRQEKQSCWKTIQNVAHIIVNGFPRYSVWVLEDIDRIKVERLELALGGNEPIDFNQVIEEDVDPSLFEDEYYQENDERSTTAPFNLFFLFCIILNAALLGSQHYGQPAWLDTLIDTSNLVFSVIFLIEMVLRWIAHFKRFWRQPFNVFDFIINVISLFEFFFLGSRAFSVFRAFRVLRVLKVMKTQQLRQVVEVIFSVLTATMYLNFVLLMVLVSASLAGEEFFSGHMTHLATKGTQVEMSELFLEYNNSASWNGTLTMEKFLALPNVAKSLERGFQPPYRVDAHFDNFLSAFYSVFQIISLDNWVVVLWNALGAGANPVVTVLFVLILVIFGNYVIVNLFLAQLVGAFEAVGHQEDRLQARKDIVLNTGALTTAVAGNAPNGEKKKRRKRRFQARSVEGAAGSAVITDKVSTTDALASDGSGVEWISDDFSDSNSSTAVVVDEETNDINLRQQLAKALAVAAARHETHHSSVIRSMVHRSSKESPLSSIPETPAAVGNVDAKDRYPLQQVQLFHPAFCNELVNFSKSRRRRIKWAVAVQSKRHDPAQSLQTPVSALKQSTSLAFATESRSPAAATPQVPYPHSSQTAHVLRIGTPKDSSRVIGGGGGHFTEGGTHQEPGGHSTWSPQAPLHRRLSVTSTGSRNDDSLPDTPDLDAALVPTMSFSHLIPREFAERGRREDTEGGFTYDETASFAAAPAEPTYHETVIANPATNKKNHHGSLGEPKRGIRFAESLETLRMFRNAGPRCPDCKTRMSIPLPHPPLTRKINAETLHQERDHCVLARIRVAKERVIKLLVKYTDAMIEDLSMAHQLLLQSVQLSKTEVEITRAVASRSTTPEVQTLDGEELIPAATTSAATGPRLAPGRNTALLRPPSAVLRLTREDWLALAFTPERVETCLEQAKTVEILRYWTSDSVGKKDGAENPLQGSSKLAESDTAAKSSGESYLSRTKKQIRRPSLLYGNAVPPPPPSTRRSLFHECALDHATMSNAVTFEFDAEGHRHRLKPHHAGLSEAALLERWNDVFKEEGEIEQSVRLALVHAHLRAWMALRREIMREWTVVHEFRVGEDQIGGALITYTQAPRPSTVVFTDSTSLFIFAPDNPIRIWIAWFLSTTPVEVVIAISIFLSCLVLALDDPNDVHRDSERSMILHWISLSLTCLFLLEISLRIISMGFILHKKSYLRDPWNALDLIVVVLSAIVDFSPRTFSGSFKAFFSTMRGLRSLRPLRLVRRNRELKLVFATLVGSTKGIFHVLVVAAINFLLFGILMVQLLSGKLWLCTDPLVADRDHCIGDYFNFETMQFTPREWINSPQNHDHLGNSILILFQISASQWVESMYQGISAVDVGIAPRPGASPYLGMLFVVFFIVGNFFMMNLLIGVVISNFNRSKDHLDGLSFVTDEQRLWVDSQRLMVKFRPTKRSLPPAYSPQEQQNLWPRIRLWFYHVAESSTLEVIVAVIVCINVIFMAVQYYDEPPVVDRMLFIVNLIFTCLYGIEIFIKLLGTGWKFFSHGWNRYMLLILVTSIVDTVMDEVFDQSLPINVFLFRTVRIFRLLRIFRLVEGASRIRALLETIFYTLPSLFNISSFILIIFFMYTVVGMQLFGHVRPGKRLDADYANFGTFTNAIQLLFVFMTGEEWNVMMYDVMVQTPECGIWITTVSQVLTWVGPLVNFTLPPAGSFNATTSIQVNATGIYELRIVNVTSSFLDDSDCGTTWAPLYFLSFLLLISFIVSDLFVAIVMDTFETTLRLDKGDVRMSDLHRFVDVWSAFDPEATMVCPTAKFPHLLAKLKPPLGIFRKPSHTDIMRKTAVYHIPDHHGQINFFETMIPLVRTVLLVNQSEVSVREEAERWRRIIDTTEQVKDLPVTRIRETIATIDHYFCATYIASAWRRFSATRRVQQVREAKAAQLGVFSPTTKTRVMRSSSEYSPKSPDEAGSQTTTLPAPHVELAQGQGKGTERGATAANRSGSPPDVHSHYSSRSRLGESIRQMVNAPPAESPQEIYLE